VVCLHGPPLCVGASPHLLGALSSRSIHSIRAATTAPGASVSGAVTCCSCGNSTLPAPKTPVSATHTYTGAAATPFGSNTNKGAKVPECAVHACFLSFALNWHSRLTSCPNRHLGRPAAAGIIFFGGQRRAVANRKRLGHTCMVLLSSAATTTSCRHKLFMLQEAWSRQQTAATTALTPFPADAAHLTFTQVLGTCRARHQPATILHFGTTNCGSTQPHFAAITTLLKRL
jgi:hypothetical protein